MPIEVKCTCGKSLKAPDSLAGKKAKCPACGAVLVVPAAEPEVFDAEVVEPEPAAADDDPYGLGDLLSQEKPFGVSKPELESAPSVPAQEERRPCRACGEMIPVAAAKCRYCGEIFDPALKRKLKKQVSGNDEEMTGADWLISICFCFQIGCIVSIVYIVQGKPKGWRMLLVAIVTQFLIGFVIGVLPQLTRR